MRVVIKVFLLVAVTAYFIHFLFRNEIYLFKADRIALPSNELMFVGGRPFARFNIGGKDQIGLVDTGATQSRIDTDRFNSKLIQQYGKIKVNTSLSTFIARTYMIHSMSFMGKNIRNIIVAKSSKWQSNTIGSPEIFSAPEVLISNTGIYYDRHIEDFENVYEVPVTQTRTNDKIPKIRSIIYHLEVNGKIENVILDTGIRELLTGTVINENSTLSSVGLFRSSGGFAFKKVYSQSTTLKIGSNTLSINYKSIPGWRSPRAKFYLGSEILKSYSLFFNFTTNKFYFIKNKVKTK